MRSIMILALFGTLLLLPGISSAETNTECMTRCAAEKASRDASCSVPGDDGGAARAQCLQESQDTFSDCIAGCPQPELPPDIPPAERAE